MNKNEWDNKFSQWSSPPSYTEEEKIDNAVKSIRKAIGNDDVLKAKNITIFVQGSYRNNVNVKKDSDVDVGILCTDTFNYEANREDIRQKVDKEFSPATYHYSTFKKDIQNALEKYFGKNAVSRGDKAFNIKENSYRVDADVVPFFEFRYYYNFDQYDEGVVLHTDNGKPSKIFNFPEQQYVNGVEKNKSSNKRYKRAVRILRKLRYKMIDEDEKYAFLENVPGYLIECLVYNTPNDKLGADSYYDMIKEVIFFLYIELKKEDIVSKWTEVNEIKYLFHSDQPWKKEDAIRFLLESWEYIGYNND